MYRDLPGDEVLISFDRLPHRSLEHLRSLDDEAWEKIGWSPEGERPFYRFQETRVLDSWIHLQDIRDALLEPSDDHGPGEEIVVNRFESALPYVIGKKAAASDGTLVQINLSGRLARSILIGVKEAGRTPSNRRATRRPWNSRPRSRSSGAVRRVASPLGRSCAPRRPTSGETRNSRRPSPKRCDHDLKDSRWSR